MSQKFNEDKPGKSKWKTAEEYMQERYASGYSPDKDFCMHFGPSDMKDCYDAGRESRSAEVDKAAAIVECKDREISRFRQEWYTLQSKLAEQAAEIARLKQVLVVSKLAIEALAESLKDEGMGLVGACIVVPATLRKIDEALAPQANEEKV